MVIFNEKITTAQHLSEEEKEIQKALGTYPQLTCPLCKVIIYADEICPLPNAPHAWACVSCSTFYTDRRM